jgi:uncharacterized protein
MKLDLNQIPPEGLTLVAELSPSELDLETDIIKFRRPITVKAEAAKITNALTVHLELNCLMQAICGRCLQEYELDFKKEVNLNYPVDKAEPFINLDPDIRDEIILDYPLKPLCRANCKGLCPKCGRNLNEGACGCN